MRGSDILQCWRLAPPLTPALSPLPGRGSTPRPPEPCTATTSSTRSSCASAWRSSATRSTAALAGELTEDEFRPLRLMNGVYLQLHAYMLRIAIPYGTLSSRQLRMLAHIARNYDTGYGHFTTRQNIQFNWPALSDMPAILAELAEVEMHAIQTSGNCIRNVTADHFAGAAADEVADPRPYAEILRQWSSLHPEFCYLPRKFKIAVTGAEQRPRRHPGPRHRPASEARRRRRARLRRLCRRRAGPHADDRQEDPRLPARGGPARPTRRRSCASTICTAAATTSTRRASRSWCTRPAPRSSRAQVEAEWQRIRRTAR